MQKSFFLSHFYFKRENLNFAILNIPQIANNIFDNLYATLELEVCAHTFYNGTVFRVINDYCIFMIQKQNKTKQNKNKNKKVS